eukprot:TRINITY_DN1781_c0_g1_i8.p1 TRINITY_DN1781_c0_g1~~TRINITY_DN1781_c0_g1_i8.p1  ORF type:complete len:278 (+),score=31.31 TRINITY_DN1781_c0_g1_i8:75-908(+)
MASEKIYFLVNRRPVVSPYKSSSEFVASQHRGVYTTARTVEQTSILDLPRHISRLTQGSFPFSLNLEEVTQLILPSLSEVVYFFHDRYKKQDDKISETRITICVSIPEGSVTKDSLIISLYGEPLPPPPLPPIYVELRVGKRENPQSKSISWALERKKFLPTGKVEEVVLMDDGKIYEGLSSNFGIICGGTLITAPNLLVCSLEILTFKTGCLLSPLTQDPALPYSPDQQILEGTVLSVVVTACTRLGIPVRRELPTVEMLEHCEAAFISSKGQTPF